MSRNHFVALFACCLLGLAMGASPAAAAPAPDLPDGPILQQADWPDDPNFARCELEDPVTGCGDDEQWNLYGPMDGLCKAPGGDTFDQPRPNTLPGGGGLPCWAQAPVMLMPEAPSGSVAFRAQQGRPPEGRGWSKTEPPGALQSPSIGP